MVLTAAKSRKLKTWKGVNNGITDALNEAKDNIKYLSTLDKYIEPLYSATPPDVAESLSALLNNLRMMHAIARYYATPQRMTALFSKITEQMTNPATPTNREILRSFAPPPAKSWVQAAAVSNAIVGKTDSM